MPEPPRPVVYSADLIVGVTRSRGFEDESRRVDLAMLPGAVASCVSVAVENEEREREGGREGERGSLNGGVQETLDWEGED